jgi:mRNA-degrading endonuclease toxin of MazEF toxin-antitoxin module
MGPDDGRVNLPAATARSPQGQRPGSHRERVAISNDRGARTSIHLACSAEVEGITGEYFVECGPQRSSKASCDRAAAARLWEVSARMTGLPAE